MQCERAKDPQWIAGSRHCFETFGKCMYGSEMYVVPRCVYIDIRDVIEDSVQNKCLIGHRGVRGFGVWQTMWKHVKVYDGFCALQPT